MDWTLRRSGPSPSRCCAGVEALTPTFEELAETTGVQVSAEGAQMLYTRYRVAAERAAGKRVLEVACGSGLGFGLLGERARSIVGGDYSFPLLRSGHTHYGTRFSLVQLSAERLPFRSESFDLVLCFEASYYVPDMGAALAEIARVLGPAGEAMFVNANPERSDFIPSPLSVHYHTADEFRTVLQRLGFEVTVSGAFPVDADAGSLRGGMASILSIARRLLRRAGLVPTTLRGRALLKRLAYGKLVELQAEIPEGFATVAARALVRPGPVSGFKVIYVLAKKVGGALSSA